MFAQPPTPAYLRPVAAILAVFAQLFVLHSPAFTLFVQPLGVGPQALPNGSFDGSLALWIAHAPGNGNCIPALYSKDLRNFGGRLSCPEQVLDVFFLGSTVGHAVVSLRANSALSWSDRCGPVPPQNI